MLEQITYTEFLMRFGVAALCGLAVGFDREVKRKPLGARAFILTSAGCAAWMMITTNYALVASDTDTEISLDPTRLIQGLVGAIGFLGAGAIISSSEGHHQRGIASGAAVWGVGAVGVACGMGFLKEAITLTVFFFVVLNLYDWLLGDRADPDDNGKL